MARRGVIADIVLWGVLSLAFLLGRPLVAAHASWSQLIVGVVVLAAAVAVSRVWPLASFTFTAAMSVAQVWGVWETSFWPTPLTLAMAVMGYLVGRRMARAAPAVAVAAVSAVVFVVLGVVLRPDGVSWTEMALLFLLGALVPWLVGRNMRQRAKLAAAGWQRAEQLEQEQHMVVEQARLRERWRIAQDMHDSLGHELSLIALRAGGLEVAPDLDWHHRAVAEQLRSAATGATERLRETVDMLREGDAQAPMQPAGETVTDLVERAQASGMVVRLDREDDPPCTPPMVGRVVYRVVQESLTNATKHASGASVTVRVEQRSDETVVTVANEAPPSSSAAEPESGRGGQGLVGLGERVRMVDGRLQAGACDGGGFEVVAWLPHTPDAATQSEKAARVEESEIPHGRDRRRVLRRRGKPGSSW